MKSNNLLEEFSINELEDRVEFGLCGGSGGGGEPCTGEGCGPTNPCSDEDWADCHAD